MSATYDPTLETDADKVRFLIGDTTPSTAQLSDEEIEAALGMETATGAARPYFCAASLLSVLKGRWSVAAGGKTISRKQVGSLSVDYGLGVNVAGAVDARIAELRRRGAEILAPSPKVLRSL